MMKESPTSSQLQNTAPDMDFSDSLFIYIPEVDSIHPEPDQLSYFGYDFFTNSLYRTIWDNRDLWKKYSYRDYGIIIEPYFDIDWNTVYYLTDTGRRWDGENISIRDKVSSRQNTTCSHLQFHSTVDIINAVVSNRFPIKAIITTHPQRWTNNPILWIEELVLQNIKNVIK